MHQKEGRRIGLGVINGALLQCTFGAAPTPLIVLPQNRIFCCHQPVATIQDSKPFVNILPFGVCRNPANPAVAAATAAAMGVLTPAPCIPATAAPWAPGIPTLLFGGTPALDMASKLTCSFGGVISVQFAGQMNSIY